jgi:hypothetical protein
MGCSARAKRQVKHLRRKGFSKTSSYKIRSAQRGKRKRRRK